ncbi:MAG: DUF445 family protein [Proteobacteria bacterium]|nr:DUF445 family protein [Pseudomonadota bacterium]
MSPSDDDHDGFELRGLQAPNWLDRVRDVRFFDLFEKYRQRVTNPKTGLPFEPTPKGKRELSLEQLAFQTGGWLRVALQVFFPICLLAFGLSFLWDFHGLLRASSVAGAIGFGTNWIAIKMLFWPRYSRPVFGHGLIPAQRDQLIEKVADEVLENLINEELILRKVEETRIVQRFSVASIEKLKTVVKDPEFRDDVKHMLLTYIGELTSNDAFREAAVRRAEASVEDFAGARFRGWLVGKLKDVWRAPLIELVNREIQQMDSTVGDGLSHLDGLLEQFPQALEKRQEAIDKVLTTMLLGLVQEVDVREIVMEQLGDVTPEQLERAFLEFADDKLSYITLLGGLFGVIGGTVIVWPLGAALVLVSGVLLLTVFDVLAYRVLSGAWRLPWVAPPASELEQQAEAT